MIPRMIHYCWFGGNPLPKTAEKCIRSWKKHCKGYELRQWNESNFDISAAPLYVRQAYEAKKWAFVTDYVRLYVVHEHGGIYLDTDVKVIRSLDSLLNYRAYFGFEDGKHIATGLGFGAEKGTPILKELMEDYLEIPFVLGDGTLDLMSCPIRNTEVFLRHGLIQDNSLQMLEGEVCILPSQCLCPFDYLTGRGRITRQTLSIHQFQASWVSEKEKKRHEEYRCQSRKEARREFIRYLPNRILLVLLGKKHYSKLIDRFKNR